MIACKKPLFYDKFDIIIREPNDVRLSFFIGHN